MAAQKRDIPQDLGNTIAEQAEICKQTKGYKGVSRAALLQAVGADNPYARYVLAQRNLAKKTDQEKTAGMNQLAKLRTQLEGRLAQGKSDPETVQLLVTVLLDSGHWLEKGLHGSHDGLNDEPARQRAAWLCYQNAHELDPSQSVNIIRCLQRGIGTPANKKEARRLLEEWARCGGAEERMEMACSMLEEEDRVQAAEWLRSALRAPNAEQVPGLTPAARYMLASLGEPNENGKVRDPAKLRETLEMYARKPIAKAYYKRALKFFPRRSATEVQALQEAKEKEKA